MIHALLAAALLSANPAPTPATASAKPAVKPPAMLRHQLEKDDVRLRVELRPAAPNPGETLVVHIDAATVTRAGSPNGMTQSRPLSGIALEVIALGPKSKRDARIATASTDPGAYAASFTAGQVGTWSLMIRMPHEGKTVTLGPITAGWGVWPLPETAKAKRIPRKLRATRGNPEHGRALCADRCKRNLPTAPKGSRLPRVVGANVAFQDADGALLSWAFGDAARGLRGFEQQDAIAYLRSLHPGVRSLIPRAGAITGQAFGLDTHAKERLADHRISPNADASQAQVFAVFDGPRNEAVARVDYSDRQAREALSKQKKLGYIIQLTKIHGIPVDELLLTIEPEPSYKIIRAVARDADPATAKRVNRALSRVKGLGAFNDGRSLRRAPKTVRKWLKKPYLLAAEFATRYYGEERAFTAFDSEFDDIEF